MFDKSKVHSRKKVSRSKEDEIPLITAKSVADFANSLVDRWPGLRQGVRTAAEVTGEKLGDLYSAVAEVVTEKKEAWEDRLAEKKSQRQSGARPKPPEKP